MMRRSNLIFTVITLLFALNIHYASAQKLMPRPPIYGIPAKTLPQGHWVFRGYAVLPHFTKKLNTTTGKMVDLPDNVELTSNRLDLKIRYGILNRLTAIVNLPLFHKHLTMPNVTKSGDGLGDVIGALLYKFYVNKAHRFLLSGLFFSKWPTGKASNLSATQMPLGTGSFDAGLAIMPEWEFGKWDMRWSAFYIVRGKNDSHVNLGDVSSFSWSTAYNFSRNLIAEGTLLYKRSTKATKNGIAIPNSDILLFQLIPGIQYRLSRTFLVQFALPLTLKSKQPFSSSYEPWIGLYYLL